MSSEAAMQIATLIKTVSEKVISSVEKTERTVVDIQNSNRQVVEASEIFMEISRMVDSTMSSIEIVTQKIADLDNVASGMAAVTQEQSASTEEILATSENLYEQSVIVTENSSNVMETAQNLNTYADTMEERLKQFNV